MFKFNGKKFGFVFAIAFIALATMACSFSALGMNLSAGPAQTTPTLAPTAVSPANAVQPTAMPMADSQPTATLAPTATTQPVTVDDHSQNIQFNPVIIVNAGAEGSGSGTGTGSGSVQAPCATCATPAPTTVATAAATAQATAEVKRVECVPVPGNTEFDLMPGYSINGAHVFAFLADEWKEFMLDPIDNTVVVVRNNSDHIVKVSSTDGAGLCNDASFDQVKMRFSEGCDSSGCGTVLDVNIKSLDNYQREEIYEATWCAANPKSLFCLNIDK